MRMLKFMASFLLGIIGLVALGNAAGASTNQTEPSCTVTKTFGALYKSNPGDYDFGTISLPGDCTDDVATAMLNNNESVHDNQLLFNQVPAGAMELKPNQGETITANLGTVTTVKVGVRVGNKDIGWGTGTSAGVTVTLKGHTKPAPEPTPVTQPTTPAPAPQPEPTVSTTKTTTVTTTVCTCRPVKPDTIVAKKTIAHHAPTHQVTRHVARKRPSYIRRRTSHHRPTKPQVICTTTTTTSTLVTTTGYKAA